MSSENQTIDSVNEIDGEKEERRRRGLLLLLLLLLLLICCIGILFVRYLIKPEPLPELLPVVNQVDYPPAYAYSFYGVDKPVGVAVSPDGSRVYVSESGGERLVKVFNRDGELLGSFAPPGTTALERSPVYIAVASDGRVFVSDRLQDAVFIYDEDGNYIDSILSPDMSLSKYLDQHMGGMMPDGTSFYYNNMKEMVNLTQPGETEQALPAPNLALWDPLGVRFDQAGNLLVTVVTDHTVRTFPAGNLHPDALVNFGGQTSMFGSFGQEAAQFNFPNIAVTDSQGRIHVSDGNNGRVSMWDAQGNFLLYYGRGTGDESLSLPRGTWIDDRDRIHIVDAVGHAVRVYDVSGDEPVFLYKFGDLGETDGLFYYPNDIAIDNAGYLFMADRENNRVQVWTY